MLRPWRPFQSESAPESLVVRRFSNASLKTAEIAVHATNSENGNHNDESDLSKLIRNIPTPPVRQSVVSAQLPVDQSPAAKRPQSSSSESTVDEFVESIPESFIPDQNNISSNISHVLEDSSLLKKSDEFEKVSGSLIEGQRTEKGSKEDSAGNVGDFDQSINFKQNEITSASSVNTEMKSSSSTQSHNDSYSSEEGGDENVQYSSRWAEEIEDTVHKSLSFISSEDTDGLGKAYIKTLFFNFFENFLNFNLEYSSCYKK